jgi:hypothetical protein
MCEIAEIFKENLQKYELTNNLGVLPYTPRSSPFVVLSLFFIVFVVVAVFVKKKRQKTTNSLLFIIYRTFE